jgi:predicted dienelactone hydrolase
MPPMRRSLTPRLLPVLLSVALLGAACSSDSDDATGASTAATTAGTAAPATTEPPPTTETPATTEPAVEEVTAADLAGPGPYAVGVTTRTLPESGAVEIWYPADESTAGGSDTYNVRTFLPPGIAALITGDIDDSFTIAATRDAAPSPDGPFPIVLFSHGASSYRLQSSTLAQHLASWGIATASTDHPSRDLLNGLGGTAEGQPPAIDQMRSMRSYLGTLGDDPVLAGALDTERVALGGHSAGGGTVAELALDPGILGYVSYASGLRESVADVPSLFLAGELDTIVPLSERTQAAFDAAPPPSWLWVIPGAGHLAFSDLCAIGGGDSNLIDLAEAAGLGAFIDERLRALATDGCDEPNVPVQDVWPAIHQSSTGFYRWVFGIDPEPIGLDESVVTEGVTVSSK